MANDCRLLAKGNLYRVKHFVVETGENVYEAVEFTSGQCVIDVKGRFGTYESIAELKEDITRVAVNRKINAKLSGYYNEILCSATITRIGDAPSA